MKKTTEIETIVKVLRDKKAEEITVIDVSKISIMMDTIIICSGLNPNHIHALYENIEESLSSMGIQINHTEGKTSASWILMDYGDFVINIFDKDSRSFYNLEHIWADGNKIEIDN